MSLLTDLVHYWKLDESSGNASPTVGSITLTNSGTTYAAAVINNGAQWGTTTATNSNTLYNTSPGTGWFNLGVNNAKTIALWFRTNATPPAASTNRFIDIRRSSSTSGEFTVSYTTDGGGRFYYYVNGTTEQYDTALTTSTWYHLAWTVSSGNAVNFYINGSSVDTATWGSAGSVGNICQFGNANGSTSGNFNGPFSVDEIGLWHRELTGSEVTQLYNGGAGLAYPFIIANPVSPSGGVAYSGGLTMY